MYYYYYYCVRTTSIKGTTAAHDWDWGWTYIWFSHRWKTIFSNDETQRWSSREILLPMWFLTKIPRFAPAFARKRFGPLRNPRLHENRKEVLIVRTTSAKQSHGARFLEPIVGFLEIFSRSRRPSDFFQRSIKCSQEEFAAFHQWDPPDHSSGFLTVEQKSNVS